MAESNHYSVLVDEYISEFAPDVQVRLQAIRQIIRESGSERRREDQLQDAYVCTAWEFGSFCRLPASYWVLPCSQGNSSFPGGTLQVQRG